MLIKNNKYEAGDICSFKLVNGDEMIAKLVKEDTDQYVLEKPMMVLVSQQGIQLMQAMFAAVQSANFDLDKQHVMLHNATADDIADHYREVTTGIKAVRRGSIITT